MEIQSGNFRKTLFDLSKHIDSSTLEGFKYLSRDAIGAAKLEKVISPLDFFRALEESGKISVNDASYLADLLEAVKKYHLAEKLASFKGGSSANNAIQESLLPLTPPQHLQQNSNFFDVPENQLNTYHLLLRKISNSLDSQDVHAICYLSQEAEYAGIRHRANLNGTMLFYFFEQSVLISPKNLQYLKGLLHNVGRLDLCQLIDQYTMVHMHGQLNKPPAPVVPLKQYHSHVIQYHGYPTEKLAPGQAMMNYGNPKLLRTTLPPSEEMTKKDGTENVQVPAEKYPMTKKPHGIAVIINNFEFFTADPGDEALPNRHGSQVDEKNLHETWEYLQYDVRILRNLTASELIHRLMLIALQSHENYDSFVCCILSHGYLDGIYGTDSQPVKINDIASLFKGNGCSTLSNKPKLFFIQACRGDDDDKGVSVQKDARGDNEDHLRHSLPSEADFLFGYATPPGNVSWRSPRYGSWYISKLCEVLVDNSPQQDLLSMLTMVNSKVSEEYTTQGYKQCPAPVTLLRKQVWFFQTG